MPTEGMALVGSYDHRLVVLSVLISILAAYAVRRTSRTHP